MKNKLDFQIKIVATGIVLIIVGLVFYGFKDVFLIKNDNIKPMDMAYVTEEIVVTNDLNEIDEYFNNNELLLSFYANTFQIEKDLLENEIKNSNEGLVFNELDLNQSGNVYATKDEAIIEYLLDLNKNKPNLFNNTRVGNTRSKKYIVSLIEYYSEIYNNIDYRVAAAIGEIESGYNATYMMSCNNIFGGMGSNGLLKYNNIEMGVLRYVRMLSKSYYGKGLNTVSSIGYVYNPTVDASGTKIASPSWVTNVTNAINKYENPNKVKTVEEVLSIVD